MEKKVIKINTGLITPDVKKEKVSESKRDVIKPNESTLLLEDGREFLK